MISAHNKLERFLPSCTGAPPAAARRPRAARAPPAGRQRADSTAAARGLPTLRHHAPLPTYYPTTLPKSLIQFHITSCLLGRDRLQPFSKH